MFKSEVDQTKNLLTFAYSGKVTQNESARWKAEVPGLLSQLKPGFTLLSDFTGVESFDLDCAPDIEVVMDLLNEAGVAKVVRVIPDPRHDIGMTIMSRFHYRRCVSIVTCETLEEGLAALAAD